MTAIQRMISVARLDLEEQYKSAGFIPKDVFDDALEAAREFTAGRMRVEISDDEVREAAMLLEGMFNIYVGREHILQNNEGHEEWLSLRRDDIGWDYWARYKHWLIEDQHRPESVVNESLDPITDRILGMLEDPSRAGAWDRRGLVAGQVQSGKTSNYVGLINKALDAGYKLIVVLAGTHDNLRSQTQSRINTGVLGFDSEGNIAGTQIGKRVGVGIYDHRKPRINCPTSSAQKGDFNRHLAKGVGALGGDPVIMVVKKNTTILRNLLAWATGMHHEIDPESGRKIVQGVPMLVIDDEADYASIDTGSVPDKETGDESDPSATNALIRELLESFEKTAYVGYTATPFANIYINPEVVHEKYGKDLFPEHFILTLPETTAYSGASAIFGLIEDEAAGIEGAEALPTTRELVDYEDWMPDGHKKVDLPSSPLPPSLVEAIHSFVLASAVKRYRRVSMKHNSMLIHVTRFIDVQAEVAYQVNEFVDQLKNQVSYLPPDSGNSEAWRNLRHLYTTDFANVHEVMRKRNVLDGASLPEIEFSGLIDSIKLVLDELRVRTINGEARDALDYEENPRGITVIAVGGDKLSRGLTLEGLTTSYYLRASRMYDTLLQMGRWFGYRPGYLDVCRLYTTSQLIRWYTRITGASERLYKEFELMAALGKTPRDFGLRIQAHPDGLMVTAANKSRRAKNLRASFSGATTETILFRDSEASRETNELALRGLYESLKSNILVERHEARPFYWRGAPAATVLKFLDTYDSHMGAVRALPKAMSEYIRACLALDEPELTTWDVLIATKSGGNESMSLGGGTTLGLILRAPDTDVTPLNGAYVIGRLLSTGDEVLPLVGNPALHAEALQIAIDNWQKSTRANKSESAPNAPSAVAERQLRDPSRGYLMVYPLEREASGLESDATPYIGFGIAFPWSDQAPSVDYKVNEIYWDLEMNQLDELGDSDE